MPPAPAWRHSSSALAGASRFRSAPRSKRATRSSARPSLRFAPQAVARPSTTSSVAVSARLAGTSANSPDQDLHQGPAASSGRPFLCPPPDGLVPECPVDLEAFELVMLRRPADAPDYDEPTLERIQREHLAYHASLRDAGHLAT